MGMKGEEITEVGIGSDEVFGVVSQQGKASEEERARWENRE